MKNAAVSTNHLTGPNDIERIIVNLCEIGALRRAVLFEPLPIEAVRLPVAILQS